MYIFLIIVHVIVCLVLVAVVLLQAGRGGGFSDMMGGAQPQSIFGTQTNEFMTRATEVCAILFIVTSLSLGILSTQRGKSLMANRSLVKNVTLPGQKLPAKDNTVPDVAKAVADTTKTVQSAAVKVDAVVDNAKASVDKTVAAAKAPDAGKA